MLRKKFLSIFLSITILSIAIIVSIALNIPAPPNITTKPQEKSWRVAVQEVRLETLAPTLHLYAQVENPQIARMRSALTANVVEVKVLDGNHITSGQSLIRFDEREARLELAQQEATMNEIKAEIQTEKQRNKTDKLCLQHEETQLRLSRRAVDRLKGLSKKNFTSEARMDEAVDNFEKNSLATRSRQLALDNYNPRINKLKARLAQAKAKRDLAALNLEWCHIIAPFNGKVTKVMVAPGTRVHPGDALIEVFNEESLELRAQIPLRYLPTIRKALAQNNDGSIIDATANVDNVEVKTVLDRLAAKIPENHGSVDAYFRLLSGTEVLELGRGVDLLLRLPSQEQVIAIPFDAIYGTDYVYVIWQDSSAVGGVGIGNNIFFKYLDLNTHTWSSRTILTYDHASASTNPDLAVDSLGHVHAIFLDTDGSLLGSGSDWDLFYKKFVGTPMQPILAEINPNPLSIGNISLSWSSAKDVINYEIYRETSQFSSVSGLTAIDTSTLTSYTDTVNATGYYYYAVVATNEYGESLVSNVEFVEVIEETSTGIFASLEIGELLIFSGIVLGSQLIFFLLTITLINSKMKSTAKPKTKKKK